MTRENIRKLIMERSDMQLPGKELEEYINEFLHKQVWEKTRSDMLCT